MKSSFLKIFLIIVIVISLSSCIADFGYRDINIISITTEPTTFNSSSTQDYTFSVNIEYENLTLQEADLWIKPHTGLKYLTEVASTKIDAMDSGAITLTFTSNAADWVYRSEYSFYAYLASATPTPMEVLLEDEGLQAETVKYWTP